MSNLRVADTKCADWPEITSTHDWMGKTVYMTKFEGRVLSLTVKDPRFDIRSLKCSLSKAEILKSVREVMLKKIQA